MKNIHVLATDKPSRLLKTIPKGNLILSKSITSGSHWENKNIYITSDEEIKEGDWILNEERSPSVLQCIGKGSLRGWKKIILTTDPELIKDGVQAIDDEFLEWFVKNSSCEEVKIESWQTKGEWDLDYKIIIPKEEPKDNFTGYFDDTNKPIFVGDRLKSKWNYEVIVVKDEDGSYSGKLVCDDKHSCKDIPYALNKGKGYSKIICL